MTALTSQPLLSLAHRIRRQPGFFRKIAALGLAVVAILLAYVDYSHPDAGFKEVVVASRDIPAGATVTEADVLVTNAPQEFIPQNAFHRQGDVLSRISAGPISQGEIVTESRFVGPSLAAHLTKDQNSKIIAITPADRGIANILRAGDAVDILTAGADGVTALPLARRGHVVSRTESGDDPVILVALPIGAAETVATMQLNNPITLMLSNQ